MLIILTAPECNDGPLAKVNALSRGAVLPQSVPHPLRHPLRRAASLPATSAIDAARLAHSRGNGGGAEGGGKALHAETWARHEAEGLTGDWNEPASLGTGRADRGIVVSLSACGSGIASGDSGLFPPQRHDDSVRGHPRTPRTRQAQRARAGPRQRRGSKPLSTIWDLFCNNDDPNTTVEVNKYLWRASLEC